MTREEKMDAAVIAGWLAADFDSDPDIYVSDEAGVMYGIVKIDEYLAARHMEPLPSRPGSDLIELLDTMESALIELEREIKKKSAPAGESVDLARLRRLGLIE